MKLVLVLTILGTFTQIIEVTSATTSSDSPAETPKCIGAHEVYNKCSSSCPRTCENKDKDIICDTKCNAKCECKKGYVRDGAWHCIPESDCQYCPKNEKYVDCKLGYCKVKKCDDLGKPIPCPGIIPPCKGGCVCKDGYVRNYAGICIPKEYCPSCGGDFNATSGCGNHCGNNCDDYDNPPGACPLYCHVNGCDCRYGYVYDHSTKTCVLPRDCPTYIDCPKNEHFTTCVNPCPPGAQCYAPCLPGCLCNKGYYRKNGKCIKKACHEDESEDESYND
uniref:Zonadhesin-like 2 n=1 Tax=Tineola bisselliella TaxID=93883 RepID=A0A891XGN4_TINBI|nr:zonadhesin-like 2 [Tineola bisselliella]